MNTALLQASHQRAFLEAHREVFGSAADGDWFDWKYRAGGGLGVGLWSGEPAASELVAFCGGTPRRLRDCGVWRPALQIGDVMVRAAWRSGGRRRGAFFRVSKALYESHLGAGRAFEWGFGFPSHRHLRLAQALGLLHDAGPMMSAVWRVGTALGRQWELKPVADDEAGWATVMAGWRGMRSSAAAWVLGDRTPEVVMWRHLRRPVPLRAALWAVNRPWHAMPVGVAVVNTAQAPGVAHWLDWIGPTNLLELGLRAAQQVAHQAGCTELHAWMSEGTWNQLGLQGALAHAEVARIGVPVASGLSAQEARHKPWWFMGADTDFL